jgi:hypothetical protein
MTSVNISEFTNTVNVTTGDNTTAVVSVPVTTVVTATATGPQGAQGVAGPVGPASAFFIYNQATAASEWTINHNLGFKPSVQAFDTGSQQIEGLVTHLSINTTAIVFVVPVAGFARLT